MDRMDLVTRREHAVATHARFFGALLDYADADCGKMLAFHLRLRGWGKAIGHGGSWRGPNGLAKYVRRNGGSGAAAVDALGLERIEPARLLLADIAELPGEPPFGAFGVCMGNGAFLAWSEHAEAGDTCAVVRPHIILTAWRS